MTAPTTGSIGTAIGHDSGTSGMTLLVPVPSGVVAGSVVCIAMFDDDVAHFPTAPAGWSVVAQVHTKTSGSNDCTISVFSHIATTSESGTYTISNAANSVREAVAWRVDGADGTSPIEAILSGVNATTTTTTPDLNSTTLGADRIVYYVGGFYTGQNTASSWTATNSFTRIATTATKQYGTIGVFSKTAASAGAVGATHCACAAAASENAGIMFAVKPPTVPATANGVTATSASAASPGVARTGYKAAVLADSPTFLWMLDDLSGTDAVDLTDNANDGVYNNHFTLGAAGPLFDSNAVSMAGPGNDSVVYCGNYLNTGAAFSAETWFNTTTSLGGTLIQVGTSGDFTVTAYMTNDGKVHFGIWDSSANTRAVADSTSTYNDGNWHHIVGTYDQSTHAIVLYVDGAQVGTASQSTYTDDGGYWAVAGGDLTGWPGTATDPGLVATFSAFAVYPAVLTSTQVTAHYDASGYSSSSTPATANGVTATSASAAPAGSVLARAKAAGVTATSASAAPVDHAGVSVTANGVTATSASAAPVGHVGVSVTANGVTATSASAASAGSVLARAKAVGITAVSASAAPAGSVLARAKAVGVTAASASAAPSGTVLARAQAVGVTAASESSAPAGHVGVSATANGVTATSASAAPVGHAGVRATANGITATSVSSAPTGTATTGGAAVATGVTAISVSSAPAGSIKARATTVGVTATSVSSAPAGSVKARATANGVTAHSVSAAAAGSATGTSTTPPVQAGIIKIVRLSPGSAAISRLSPGSAAISRLSPGKIAISRTV